MEIRGIGMAGTGGRRRGAGRPKGSGDKNLQLVRDALQENRAVLIRKAIKLATGKKPNAAVLCKLIDKLLPSLHSQEIRATPFPVEVVRIIDNIP